MNNLYYKTREDKPKWVVDNFPELFKAPSILDIGCDKKQLKRYIPENTHYIGLDISKEADINFNLDSGNVLPFKDREFNLVVALDILEHIENIHQIFDELCRVSSKSILISLPNNLQSAIKGYIFRKYNKDKNYQLQHGKYSKFYGLPFEKPEDRHRWFFNSEEAESFVNYRANKNGFNVVGIKYEIDMQSTIRKIFRFIIVGFSRRRMLDFFSGTIFFVLEKK